MTHSLNFHFTYRARRLLRIALSAMLMLVVLLGSSAQAQFWKEKQPALLKGEQAFSHSVWLDGDALVVEWIVAQDYYMYRDQFNVEIADSGLELATPSYPQGVIEDDPEFGEVVVYFNSVSYRLPILKLPEQLDNIKLKLIAQGCNKPVGVCYPPQFRDITLDLSEAKIASDGASDFGSDSTGFSAPQQNSGGSFWAYILASLGAGILLSFTPCVLPMIPILAGVIAGQENPSRMRSGWLAICYVAGTIVTYAIAGWIAGATGTQLQAHFQNPWVIGFICSLLLLLAASLFGAFKIQLPSSIQTKLSSTSVSSRSASISTFVLGLISALVVGACVSPILIINLGAAIAQGDPVLGAGIMSSMAFGMGLLLVAFGFGAGWLLPRAGAWMNEIQVIFGFMVIGVAIYLAGFIAATPVLLLWALLLLWAGFYIFRLAKRNEQLGFSTFIRATGTALIIWGGLSLVGFSVGGDDVLKPLNRLSSSLSGGTEKREKVPFSRVTTVAQVKALLDQAKQNQKPTLVDFYADWCLDCIRMARTTFTEAEVHSALDNWLLIEVDVTDTNQDSEAVKKFFGVFGPPATLYVAPDGNEYPNTRQYGYMSKSEFLDRRNSAK